MFEHVKISVLWLLYLLKHVKISVFSIVALIYVGARGERIVFSGPNTNTTTIRFQKFGRIQVRVLFGSEYMAEYEYDYYSGSETLPNTNTNTIRVQKFGQIQIRILFMVPIFSEY